MQHLIGQEVINVHRRREDGSYEKGVLVDVLDGANTLLGIAWPGRNYVSWLPMQDIALASTYPESRFGDCSMTPATYRIRRAINTQGVALWFAEYITHNLEVRYLAHAAVPDPICKLVAKLTGRDTLMTRIR